MKAETKKKLFEILEKVDGSAELLELVKADLKVDDDTEAKARKLEKTVESFAGIDIAEMKALKGFADQHGGVDGITKLAVKATEGESEKLKVSELQKKFDADLATHKADAERVQSESKRYAMELKLQPFFIENFQNGDRLMKNAIADGLIIESETGLCYKTGDTMKSLDKGGWEDLKQHDSVKWALKTPAGGGIGGGTNGGNTGGAGKAANPFD